MELRTLKHIMNLEDDPSYIQRETPATRSTFEINPPHSNYPMRGALLKRPHSNRYAHYLDTLRYYMGKIKRIFK